MPRRDHFKRRLKPHFAFLLIATFLAILWISGGASRADVLGQVVVRGAAWAILIVFILFARPPQLRHLAPVTFFVLASAVLVGLQLVPLPPSVWTALPGRDLLEQAAIINGEEQPWRPLSVSPGWTVNALSSLIVPIVILLLTAALNRTEHWRVATLLLCLVIASSILGLLQFSGARFDHPLINDVRGSVSASFANRNHFALFAAIGCVLAPAWALREGHQARWRTPTAIALLILFALIILATGSRTGMLLGIVGITIGLLNVRSKIVTGLRQLPTSISVALIAATVTLLVIAIVLSVTMGRAISIDRALSLELVEDLRRQALPTVVAMTKLYFPFGSGVGTFDPVYRIHEPDALLSAAYFNRAHNDLLEVVLDAGLPGLLLLSTAILWWLWKSVTAWRSAGTDQLLQRLGSGILLLVLLASITDYPARTPMIMAVVVIAAVWLQGSASIARGALAGSSATKGKNGRAPQIDVT